MFFFYRGIGGLLAMLSPWAVGIVLRYPLQLIVHFDSHILLGDDLWSNGLAMFLGGILTAIVLDRQKSRASSHLTTGVSSSTAAGVHDYAPAATGTALDTSAEQIDNPKFQDSRTEEEPFENDEGEDVSGSKNVGSTVEPLETDVFSNEDMNDTSRSSATRLLGTFVQYWLHQQPHPHHFCFISTDRIALGWIVIGVLSMILDLINFILSPLGGLMNVILWSSIVGSVSFCCWMGCAPVPAVVQEASSPEAPESLDGPQSAGETAAEGGDAKGVATDSAGVNDMVIKDGILLVH